MRKSFTVIALSTAMFMTGAQAAEAAVAQSAAPSSASVSVTAGLRKVIKTKASKGTPLVVKTRATVKVIKTASRAKKPAKPVIKTASRAKKPAMPVIKTAKRK